MRAVYFAALGLAIGFSSNSATAAKPRPPMAAYANDGSGICAALLKQGIRDTEVVNISESRFLENQSQICTTNYENYSKAKSAAESGGLDVPGYFGISAAAANAEAEYSTKYTNYCQASYAKAVSDDQLHTFMNRANLGVLHSFDHCVDVQAQTFVRYVEPLANGKTFKVVFKNRLEGDGKFIVSKLTIRDTATNSDLKLNRDCDFTDALPYKSELNALTITCTKRPDQEIVVSGATNLGLIEPVIIRAIPVPPPAFADRLATAEQRISALVKDRDSLSINILKAFPVGTILLLEKPQAVPNGWSDCSQDNSLSDHYIRISKNTLDSALPPNGGTLTPSAKTSNSGFTYDGGRPADPGRDSRRSPGPNENMSVDLPLYAYVGCIVKNGK